MTGKKRQIDPMKNKLDSSKNEQDNHQGKKGLVAVKSVSSWNTGFSQTTVQHLTVGAVR